MKHRFVAALAAATAVASVLTVGSDPAAATVVAPCNAASGRLLALCEISSALATTGATGRLGVTGASGTDGTWSTTSGAGQAVSNTDHRTTVPWTVAGRARAATPQDNILADYANGGGYASVTYVYGVSGRLYHQRQIVAQTTYGVFNGHPSLSVRGSVQTLSCRQVGASRNPGKDCSTGTLTTFQPDLTKRFSLSFGSAGAVRFAQPSVQRAYTLKKKASGGFGRTLRSSRASTFTFSGTVTSDALRGTVVVPLAGTPTARTRVTARRAVDTWQVSAAAA